MKFKKALAIVDGTIDARQYAIQFSDKLEEAWELIKDEAKSMQKVREMGFGRFLICLACYKPFKDNGHDTCNDCVDWDYSA